MIQEPRSDFDFNEHKKSSGLSRREFLKTLGGGIFFFFTVGGTFALTPQRRRGGSLPSDFNAFLRIGEDGKVTCLTGKIEMGQGIVTSLPQMLADELDVPLEDVEIVMGDTDLCPWDMGTWGSMTTRFFGPSLRLAAAEARGILMEMAAEQLSTPLSNLECKAGVIYVKKAPGKKVSYADLAKGKNIERYLDIKPTLKDFKQLKVVGKPTLRRDAAAKVTGEAQFAGDIQLPGMLYARILRPPAHGAKLTSVDTSGVSDIKGAQLVRDGDFIAVLHRDFDIAEQALKRIKANYASPEADVDENTIFKHLLSVAPQGEIAAEGGSLSAGKSASDIIVEQEYLDGYVAHATIETHTAVATIEGEKMTVWASTQSPFGVKESVARALGIQSNDVRVITPFVGGGFGGKGSGGQAVEAARLAKLSRKPIKLIWSREEEFYFDTFRPAAIVKIASGTKESGHINFWDYRVYFAGSRGSEQGYNIPNHRTTVHGTRWTGAPGTHPFATGAWRAPGANTNIFAVESQIDIMAHKTGIDPLEFRLKNLKDKQMIRVLETAAEKFNWTPAKSPSGRGYGIACGIDAGTYVAEMAEVKVDKRTGHVQVERVVCAQDMGLVINPAGAKIQVEGCITMGLGYALTEEVHFKGGEILDINFDTYEIPRFSWVPQIETVLVEANESPPQGGGEPAIVPVGAMIANAIFDATGARLHQLPMTSDRIMKTLSDA